MAASFYSSPLIGATTTLACFAHEIPHEIADYSILVRSGFSKRQAMQSQYITAIGAFVSDLRSILIDLCYCSTFLSVGPESPTVSQLFDEVHVPFHPRTCCSRWDEKHLYTTRTCPPEPGVETIRSVECFAVKPRSIAICSHESPSDLFYLTHETFRTMHRICHSHRWSSASTSNRSWVYAT